MTKAELAESIYRLHGGMPRKQALEIIDFILGLVKSNMASGTVVKISGFGRFEVRERKGRIGTNPQTGLPMMLSEGHSVSFRPSKKLIAALNRDRSL